MRKHPEDACLTALISALVILMLIEAARRHFFPGSSPWSIRAAAGCLAWLVSIGMAKAASVGAHIRVACIDSMVSPTVRRRLSQFADIVFLLFCLASFMVGTAVLYRSLLRTDPFTNRIIYAAIPAGSALTILRLLQRLVKNGPEDDA